MEQEIYVGLPTLSLLPLNNAKFKVVDSLVIIVPREGNYHELSPEVFDDVTGAFNLLDNNTLYLPSITKVLLATGKYPTLERNQLFTPFSIEFGKEEVTIQGSVLEIISIER